MTSRLPASRSTNSCMPSHSYRTAPCDEGFSCSRFPRQASDQKALSDLDEKQVRERRSGHKDAESKGWHDEAESGSEGRHGQEHSDRSEERRVGKECRSRWSP